MKQSSTGACLADEKRLFSLHYLCCKLFSSTWHLLLLDAKFKNRQKLDQLGIVRKMC